MVVLHKASMVDVKLPRIGMYQTISKVAGAFQLQVFDPEMYTDQVKYFISMKYVHSLTPIGGVNLEDGRIVIAFQKRV